jgi:hypothetical protein
MVTAKLEKRSHLSQKCWSKRFDHHARLAGFEPRTQTPAHFPRFHYRLNTRPCDLPLRGDFTGLRGQAALQVPAGAGNPPRAHRLTASADRLASLSAPGPAIRTIRPSAGTWAWTSECRQCQRCQLGNRVGAARCLGTAGRSTTRGCVADYVEQGAQYAGDLRSDSRRHQLDPLHEMLGD